MDWRRKIQITKLANGILQSNVLNRPPIELIYGIMKERGIKFEERNEHDDEFCGVYIEQGNTKIIFVNSNLRQTRKHFTIAHELGHHYLGHTLKNGAIICDNSMLNAKNKERPEQEKEADFFAACLLMPERLVKKKKAEYVQDQDQQCNLFSVPPSANELTNHLSGYFQVSKEAMGYRLLELHLA